MSISKIEIWEHITRKDVRQNKDKIFLFGDNLIERGLGGQAKEILAAFRLRKHRIIIGRVFSPIRNLPPIVW